MSGPPARAPAGRCAAGSDRMAPPPRVVPPTGSRGSCSTTFPQGKARRGRNRVKRSRNLAVISAQSSSDRLCCVGGCLHGRRGDEQGSVKVAFDSRPVTDPRGVGRYSRCLLKALDETADPHVEIVETHRPRRADVFHAPWMEGAMLHSPCPMVVTLHDLAALKRRSEHLRTSVRPLLRQLAVQRAERVIVPTAALARDAFARLGLERERVVVIPEAPDTIMYPRTPAQIAEARARFALPERYLLWVGGLQHPDPGQHIVELAAPPPMAARAAQCPPHRVRPR